MSQTTKQLRRLNWGCGRHGEEGWINADRQGGPGVQITTDIRGGLPLEESCIDYIVSIHALQEVPFPEVVDVLKELRRVLVPGGTLRLCLPDLEKNLAALRREDRGFFLVPDGDAATLSGKFIVQVLWYSHSRLMFTFEFIEELLVKAGFRSVRRCQCGQSDSGRTGITELDNRPDESLFVEATK